MHLYTTPSFFDPSYTRPYPGESGRCAREFPRVRAKSMDRPWSESTDGTHPAPAKQRGRSLSDGADVLARQGTLLHPASGTQRSSEELGILLGGGRSRRASRDKLLPALGGGVEAGQVRLEASKKGRARVEVDVVVERECVVEGGEVRGRLEVRVSGGRGGAGLRVGGGKVRVVGFEGELGGGGGGE